MLFRIINTDLILNGKFLKENSVIDMTDQEFQKEKKYFGNYLIPFFDDTNTEKILKVNNEIHNLPDKKLTKPITLAINKRSRKKISQQVSDPK